MPMRSLAQHEAQIATQPAEQLAEAEEPHLLSAGAVGQEPVEVLDLALGHRASALPVVHPARVAHRDQRPGMAASTTIRLFLWCPAHAALETGSMDDWEEYFCAVAHERAGAIREGAGGDG